MTFVASMFQGKDDASPADPDRPLPTLRPDHAVTDIRGGPRPGTPMPGAAGRHVVGTAPGECPPDAARVVVPSVVKAAESNVPGSDWPSPSLAADRSPEGYSSPPGSTSGSATPLAPNRYVRRPGQNRHPSNGRFLATEDIGAGHSTLSQQPEGPGGPFGAQQSDPMVRSLRAGDLAGTADHCDGSPPSPMRVALAIEAASVGASRLDLTSAQGPLLSQLARNVDPSPISRPSRTLGDGSSGTSGANPVAQNPRPAGGLRAADQPVLAGPLAGTIASHMNNPPAFGFSPRDVSGHCPGES